MNVPHPDDLPIDLYPTVVFLEPLPPDVFAAFYKLDRNPYRHDHNPLNADLHGGRCSACEWVDPAPDA